MFTVSILANQSLVRREFSDVLSCVDWVWVVLGADLCPCRVHVEVMSGAGLCMHVAGAFVSIARLH